MLLGALEAGGTKMVCAVGDENLKILEKEVIPTTDPDETITRICGFFKDKDIKALGVGAFGPVNLNKKSDKYGCILDSTKLAWRHYPLRENLIRALNVPVGIDTDVNAACLGEVSAGRGAGCDPVLYLTVGTGVGAGIYVNGGLLHGMLHPEGGHIYLKRHPDDINTKDTYTEEKNHKNKKPMDNNIKDNNIKDNNIKDNNTKDDNTHYNNPKDNYPADYNPEDNKPKNNNSTNYNSMDNSTGYCHYHRDCLEDLAAGPAIEIRWGSRAELLKDNKEVWELESYYLAQALVDYIMILSPEIIILGGGVMKQEQLFPLIREKVKELVGGYIRTEQMDNLDNYIVPAGLNGDQGIIGCLQLAKTAVQ